MLGAAHVSHHGRELGEGMVANFLSMFHPRLRVASFVLHSEPSSVSERVAAIEPCGLSGPWKN